MDFSVVNMDIPSNVNDFQVRASFTFLLPKSYDHQNTRHLTLSSCFRLPSNSRASFTHEFINFMIFRLMNNLFFFLLLYLFGSPIGMIRILVLFSVPLFFVYRLSILTEVFLFLRVWSWSWFQIGTLVWIKSTPFEHLVWLITTSFKRYPELKVFIVIATVSFRIIRIGVVLLYLSLCFD